MPGLYTTEDIVSLPLDPKQRFVALEEICRKRYEAIIEHEEQWHNVQDARLSYMGTIVGAAKQLRIEPIASMKMPRKSEWNDDRYEDFKNELEFYLVQLALQGADQNHKLSIVLEGNTKARLQTLIAHMRDHVRNLDLSPGKIDRLIDRIGDFEKELEGHRLGFASVAYLTLFVAGAIADLGGAADQIRHLVNEVEAVIGVTKEEQDADAVGRVPSIEIKKIERLEPPTPKTPKQSFDLDDEIPF